MEYLWIGIGAAAGANGRYLLGQFVANRLGTDFPYGTLIVNLSGAFIIGVVQHLGTEPILVIPDNTRLFLTTGMMGGLTTYSTFSYETVRLMESGLWTEAWINITVTTVICLILCFLGMSVGRTIVSPRG